MVADELAAQGKLLRHVCVSGLRVLIGRAAEDKRGQSVAAGHKGSHACTCLRLQTPVFAQ